MRQVTFNAVQAFNANKKFKQSNTEVTTSSYEGGIHADLRLHGNIIARKHTNNYGDVDFSISNCGWFTPTTKERLNGLDGVTIYQRKGKWYLNGKEWGGAWVNIEDWNDGYYDGDAYYTEQI